MPPKRFTAVYFTSTDRKPFVDQLCQIVLNECNFEIKTVYTIEDLMPLVMYCHNRLNFVVLDIDHLNNIPDVQTFDIMTSLRTLIQINNSHLSPEDQAARKVLLIGVVGSHTDPCLIRESIKLVDGIHIKTGESWDFRNNVIPSIKKMLEGDFSLPVEVKELLKKHKTKCKQDPSNIELTPRQSQILKLVSTRGASNKIIAKTLNISESTVKLHIGAIFKKYGVKNRTQLALFSQKKDSSTHV